MRVLFILFVIFLAGAPIVQAEKEVYEPEQEESSESDSLTGAINEILQGEENKDSIIKPQNDNLWKFGSIMYNDKNMEWLNKAVEAHKRGIHISNLLPDIFPPDGKLGIDLNTGEKINPRIIDVPDVAKPVSAPVFYLSSILYLEPDNWSVWINGQKVSFGEEHEEFEIVKVNESNVSLIWRDTMIDYIFPEWGEYFEPMSDDRFVSNNKNIVIDVETGDVSFVLGVNQTLDTSVMQVVEGEIKPKDIATSNAVDVDNEDLEFDSGFDGNYPDDIILPNGAEGYNNNRSRGNPRANPMDNYMRQLNGLKSILGK